MDYMTEEYKDYIIKLEYDYDAESPLDWTTPEERGATFALFHKRYTLPMEIDADLDEYDSWTEFAKANAPEGQPLYKFVEWHEHSGVVVHLSDEENGQGWDSGIAGVIFGEDENAIKGAFEDWKYYTEGDVYRYVTYAPNPSGLDDDEEIDACGGCFGYDYTIERAKEEIDAYIKQRPRVKAPSASAYHN